MSACTEMGCIVCLLEWETFTESEIHHMDGKVKPGSHLLTIPLCYRHHREGSDNEIYTSRHPHKKKFEDRYGTEAILHNATRERLS